MSEEKKKVPQIVRVESFLEKRYEFKRNVINQRVEYRLKGKSEYKELNLNSVSRLLQHVGFNIKLDALHSLFKSDFVKDYNPMQEYFDVLPLWDGKTDHITTL